MRSIDLTQQDMDIYNLWEKIYPERLAPGETLLDARFYPDNSDIIETPIQERIRNMIMHNRQYIDYIDATINPELAPKKYYSDGIKIDYKHLKQSNAAYRRRCAKHEWGLPGLEKLIIIDQGEAYSKLN
jgi:hypothetical protein